jgi:site-specific recombinase XerD
MRKSDQLSHQVQAFFQEYLSAQRGLSPNTVFAYRDTIKLYLSFLASHLGRRVSALLPDDLHVDTVFAFLEHIESARNNKIVTRNLRLSALRTFFEYMSAKDPLRSGQYQRIAAVPAKHAPKPLIQYLEVHEMKSILDAIDRKEAAGGAIMPY